MNIVDIIIKKKQGMELTKDEIDFFVGGVTNKSVEDYQISALLMAICLKGFNYRETVDLTMAMVNSGEVFDLSEIKGIKVDKHSTGGVADTTTLILAPLVASLGLPVIKMSGRGLGHTGGTLDKLESIKGFNINLTKEQAFKQIEKCGIVIMGQTEKLVPADKYLYRLRDVTGTVDSIPLIAASVMSKKIAAGADCIVLDVKCGSGAFMKDYNSARELAKYMINIGKGVNRQVNVVISDMNKPLGMYVGNSLEVMEAIEVLKGNVTGDLLEVSLALGSRMLVLGKITEDEAEARKMLLENIKNGKGLAKLRELIENQNGNSKVIEDYSLFKQPLCKNKLVAHRTGYITAMNTYEIGRASVVTGAGRTNKDMPIDYSAGIVFKNTLGDYVEKGQIIGEVYSDNNEKGSRAVQILDKAIVIEDNKFEKINPVLEVLK